MLWSFGLSLQGGAEAAFGSTSCQGDRGARFLSWNKGAQGLLGAEYMSNALAVSHCLKSQAWETRAGPPVSDRGSRGGGGVFFLLSPLALPPDTL